MRRRRSNRRKVFGEGDELGFESKLVYEYGSLTCGFGGENDRLVKMPPLNDGMAMKEHLKSWAHAVACAVR
ncbi:hypothetical protein HS088_TW14G00392 [Tripterygium wilfordii]|uniref:Uncharacterized protein n=1 Tax=Tripterygium wilfordii TaxID=458696 RepID=A0A7J7CQC3_TRIWF|nr:hypothetical protein HS088_TW14G00392 [Tripterygium wilfordii]